MPVSLKNLSELVKQLQALIAGALPYPVKFVPLFNPQIVEDLWLPTSLLALTASAINFNLVQFRQKPALAWRLCYIGLLASGISLVVMLAPVENLLLSEYPSVQFFLAELVFIGFFLGIGFSTGWLSGRVLRLRPVTPND